MKIIDAHHHLWSRPEQYRWLGNPCLAPLRRPFTFDDLQPHLAAAGVERTIVVEGGRCDTREAAELLHIACAEDRIAGGRRVG